MSRKELCMRKYGLTELYEVPCTPSLHFIFALMLLCGLTSTTTHYILNCLYDQEPGYESHDLHGEALRLRRMLLLAAWDPRPQLCGLAILVVYGGIGASL